MLTREIGLLRNKNAALDLGCATGKMTFKLAPHFKNIIGIDISPTMINIAKRKIPAMDSRNIEFKIADLEAGIPCGDKSVEFVNMNLGTASDISNIQALLQEIGRILIPSGKFILSFYNSKALFYKWFIPFDIFLLHAKLLYKNIKNNKIHI